VPLGCVLWVCVFVSNSAPVKRKLSTHLQLGRVDELEVVNKEMYSSRLKDFSVKVRALYSLLQRTHGTHIHNTRTYLHIHSVSHTHTHTHTYTHIHTHTHTHTLTYTYIHTYIHTNAQGRQLHPRKDSASPDYPSWFETDHWPLLGEFTAANRKGSQIFKIPQKRRIRYVCYENVFLSCTPLFINWACDMSLSLSKNNNRCAGSTEWGKALWLYIHDARESWDKIRVGQNRRFAPCMTVSLVTFLKITYIHRIYMVMHMYQCFF